MKRVLILFLISNFFSVQSVESISNREVELELKLKTLETQLSYTKKALKSMEENLVEIKSAPPPVGFIYTQLPRQPSPSEIWTGSVWEDITRSYAGMFFRALGGGSAAWGSSQGENSPRITEVYSKLDRANGGSQVTRVSIPAVGHSDWIWTGDDMPGYPHSLVRSSFVGSGGEVRPKNYGVKLWKRV